MQYALMKISKAKYVLVDASEYEYLRDFKGYIISDYEPPEENTCLKIVYGSIIPQSEWSEEDVIKNVNKYKGYALGYIHDNLCHLIELLDIALYNEDDTENRTKYIPFGALIRTVLDIPTMKKNAITAFIRYGNMKPEDNVLNRFGVYSIKDQERRIKGNVTKENWKSFIDKERAIRVGLKVK